MGLLTTFPGANAGPTTPNPLVVPAHGGDTTASAREVGHDAGHERDPDREAGDLYSGFRPRALVFRPGQPPSLRPPGHDSRPIPNPSTNDQHHEMHRMNEHMQWGAHGELKPGLHDPKGYMQPMATHRNTFRAPPQPWDTAYYVTPAGDDA